LPTFNYKTSSFTEFNLKVLPKGKWIVKDECYIAITHLSSRAEENVI
jgi:hypothetical protein